MSEQELIEVFVNFHINKTLLFDKFFLFSFATKLSQFLSRRNNRDRNKITISRALVAQARLIL